MTNEEERSRLSKLEWITAQQRLEIGELKDQCKTMKVVLDGLRTQSLLVKGGMIFFGFVGTLIALVIPSINSISEWFKR
tara:strand:- start:1714 stop:1950 length:237 start_codon:yes stop_codon:yes gene_type:complete